MALEYQELRDHRLMMDSLMKGRLDGTGRGMFQERHFQPRSKAHT